MARDDITPYKGDGDRISHPITASQAFLSGEPVALVAGTLSEAGDDPASISGIAATQSIRANGTAHPVGTMMTVYSAQDTQTFRARNFATDGAGTAVVPTAAVVGDLAGLTLTGGGDWVVDTGTANLILEVLGVLDSQGQNLGDPNLLPGAGSQVLFRFL